MPPEALILGFDTSAAHCAAALLCGDRLVVSRVEPMEKGQAERLVQMLEEVLVEGGIGWRDLSALAVCTGPGNFTGVRIAVAAARGLALGLGVPAIGVTLFEVMAWQKWSPSSLVCLPAPRDCAYVQHFTHEDPTGSPRLIDPVSAPRDLQTSNMHVLGYRADQVGRQFEASWDVAELPSIPDTLGKIADLKLIRGTRIERPAPCYARPADAALPSEPPPVILP